MANTVRFEASPVEDRGTPETVWQQWTPNFAALDMSTCRRLVVIAPHPDDEILGLGGTAAGLAAVGVDVSVVSVTDGGASHPGSPTYGRADLERIRRLESITALGELGLPPPHRLGLPDGHIAQHEDLLAGELAEFLDGSGPGTWCAATFSGDGHPDHEATGRVAQMVAAAVGATYVEYPIWMWHWAVPDDDGVPWDRARTVSLSPEQMEAKRRAVSRFRSQIDDLSPDPADRAVLPPWVLDRLLRETETVFLEDVRAV
ncbi:acetylglucosaminylphosphatidylinositol deacetylase [Rhodococcoides trifolii]|uniref:Acetylglucosaminylphosphatidylinositol deacetylase n=1 Tax=Rhodococcoides trifolii TaxID=908250 RepID=A0A917G3M1_9NOCA|nr:PIG-L deacetylase family protein [Rhodococcus trifolii]GGG20200.1 acetylglucosaminylphosphatidylinositol deacetylase [Rhodococcus trifolii]